MRVAYFTESLPPNTDGVVTTLCRLVETLEEENVEFLFFSPFKPNGGLTWAERVRKVASIPFVLYPTYRVSFPYFHGIAGELDRFQPDLIHIVSPTLLGLYGMQYARKRGKPVVTSYHTHFTRYFGYYGFGNMEEVGWNYLRWFHNQCDRTYAPTPSTVRELTQRGFRFVDLWARGIDLHRFSPSKRDEELRRSIGAEHKPVLLFTGRLVKEKDLDDLIAANQILKSRGRDFVQVFVGEGPMRDEIRRKLPEAILPGFLHGESLSRWYASADLFTFPSTTEAFGNVILEAFASGLPAVGVNSGGVADLITPGMDGELARPNNPEDLANKIDALLCQPEKRIAYGEKALITASRYCWKRINKGLIESYHLMTQTEN